jgi:hypothetical protein
MELEERHEEPLAGKHRCEEEHELKRDEDERGKDDTGEDEEASKVAGQQTPYMKDRYHPGGSQVPMMPMFLSFWFPITSTKSRTMKHTNLSGKNDMRNHLQVSTTRAEEPSLRRNQNLRWKTTEPASTPTREARCSFRFSFCAHGEVWDVLEAGSASGMMNDLRK